MKNRIIFAILMIMSSILIIGCGKNSSVYIQPFTEPYTYGSIREVYLDFNAINKTNEDYLVEFTLVIKGTTKDDNGASISFQHNIPNIRAVAYANSTTGYAVKQYTSKGYFNDRALQMYEEEMCKSITVKNLKVTKASKKKNLINYFDASGQPQYQTNGVIDLEAFNRIVS